MAMSSPQELTSEIEAQPVLPEVAGREGFHGYGVVGVPYSSGHLLGLRRFPATSVGPGYTSVWHRDPEGRWTMYQDQEPLVACPRVFGPEIDAARQVPIGLEWTGSHRLRVSIASDEVRLDWDIPLAGNRASRALSSISSRLPRGVRHNPLWLIVAGRVAGRALGAGRVRLSGVAPSGQDFFADLSRVWLIEGSKATIDGVDLGEQAPLPEQQRLGDFWLPQRGLFAIGDSFFDTYTPERHRQASTRHDLAAGSAGTPPG